MDVLCIWFSDVLSLNLEHISDVLSSVFYVLSTGSEILEKMMF